MSTPHCEAIRPDGTRCHAQPSQLYEVGTVTVDGFEVTGPRRWRFCAACYATYWAPHDTDPLPRIALRPVEEAA